MPFLLGLIVVSGELWAIKTTFASALQTNAWFVLLVVACSVLGVLLNFSLFFCTTHNSALTTTVIGVLKGVVATILGFFLLGGVQFHVVNVVRAYPCYIPPTQPLLRTSGPRRMRARP